MAYINEFVPKGEKRTFNLRYGRKKTPEVWTIDKEKDYILFKDYTEIDEPVNEHFVFVYKNRVITMVLDGSEFADHNTIIWKISGITIPEDLSREEVLNELREALKVYGCFGNPTNLNLKNGKAITNF